MGLIKANEKPIGEMTQKELISFINTKVRIAIKKERPKYEEKDMFVLRKNQVRCFEHESLLIFDNDKDGNAKYRFCLGVGTVTKIIKGDKCDLVYINFGRSYAREIIVANNYPRRQLLTLKKGHTVTFYGKFKTYPEQKKRKIVFYANGLQDWYVPIAADFKKLIKETRDTNFFDSEMTIEEETDLSNFIDELIENKEKGDKKHGL